jgi:hypothetical protein
VVYHRLVTNPSHPTRRSCFSVIVFRDHHVIG